MESRGATPPVEVASLRLDSSTDSSQDSRSRLSRFFRAVARGAFPWRSFVPSPAATTTRMSDIADDPIVGKPLDRYADRVAFRSRYFDARAALMDALEVSRDVVFVVDRCGTIIFANKPFARPVVDQDIFFILGQSESAAADDRKLRFFLEPVAQCLAGDEEISERLASLDDGSGERIYRLSVRHFPVGNWSTCLVAVFNDITELHRLQRQLCQSERLAEMGRLAAKTAHEIKNQISAMRATAQLASMLPDPAEKDALLHHITESIDNLDGFVCEFAQASNPGGDALKAGSAVELMRRVIRLMRASFRQKGIELIDAMPDSIPDVLMDGRALRQAFLNLLTNALEATERGGSVRLTAWVIREARRLAVEIADTGAGIPAEIQAKLFTPFLTTKKGGAGLGLVVTQQIVVDTHGGAIRIDSHEGKGTRVTVELRLADPA